MVKSKFYNLDTDTTLGGANASDLYVASEKAVKTYVDNSIPTVNNATLTIQRNGTTVKTFTANASTNVTADITVPTTAADVGALPDTTFIPTITDTYSATSTDGMSGKAVASAISTKQDTISDLATIRSGASLGATAVQPSDLSTYVTTDTAQDVTGQKTIVGQTILKASASASSGANTVSGFQFQNSVGTFVGRLTSTESNGLCLHSPSYIQLRPFTKASGAIDYSGVALNKYDLSPATSTNVAHPYDLGSSFIHWTNLYLDSTIYAGSNNYAIALPNKAGTMALTSDIQTVNNPTITFTQGGVTKGSFTLNQSSGDTIALDAGGSSSYTAGTAIDITSDVISVKYDNSTITVNASGQLQAAMEVFTAAEVQTIWESL